MCAVVADLIGRKQVAGFLIEQHNACYLMAGQLDYVELGAAHDRKRRRFSAIAAVHHRLLSAASFVELYVPEATPYCFDIIRAAPAMPRWLT